MSDQTCDCCASTLERLETNETSGHWLGQGPVLEKRLPRELAQAMGERFGTEPITTLEEFVSVARREVGGSLAVDDLCHTTPDTPHYAQQGEETHHFRCFLDAVALAHIVDESVEFYTESPAGQPIEGQVTPTGTVTTTPEDVVVSFGVSVEDGHTGEADVATAVEAAICPYIRAFAGREAYEEWAERVAVPTVGMWLDGGASFVVALTE